VSFFSLFHEFVSGGGFACVDCDKASGCALWLAARSSKHSASTVSVSVTFSACLCTVLLFRVALCICIWVEVGIPKLTDAAKVRGRAMIEMNV
jgi:hypothetical protein